MHNPYAHRCDHCGGLVDEAAIDPFLCTPCDKHWRKVKDWISLFLLVICVFAIAASVCR